MRNRLHVYRLNNMNIYMMHLHVYRLTCPVRSVGRTMPRFVAATEGTGFGVTTMWNSRMVCNSPELG